MPKFTLLHRPAGHGATQLLRNYSVLLQHPDASAHNCSSLLDASLGQKPTVYRTILYCTCIPARAACPPKQSTMTVSSMNNFTDDWLLSCMSQGSALQALCWSCWTLNRTVSARYLRCKHNRLSPFATQATRVTLQVLCWSCWTPNRTAALWITTWTCP